MGGSAFVDGKEYKEFDNFHYSKFTDENGVTFISSEHYYQYSKCVNDEDREKVLKSSIENVYSVGQRVDLREDWEKTKLMKMYEGNRMKYFQNEYLGNQLKDTKGEIVVPSIMFGCLFWGSGVEGVCEGENWNGKILMAIRDELNGKGNEDFILEIRYRNFMMN